VIDGCWGYNLGGSFFSPAREISFAVTPGEIVLLSGPNGVGKTTILRGLLGLTRSRRGSLTWNIDRSQIGYVPQESVIDRSIPATVLDIVRTGEPLLWPSGKRAALDALQFVGIGNLASRHIARLSGGQRQRVLVARALAGDPQLLLLDEPTINVDEDSARQIGRLIRRLADERGLGVVATSHVTDWVEADREVTVRSATQ
jgi:ABC-type Mn2+/Zn2+ transport system ATPase subunit